MKIENNIKYINNSIINMDLTQQKLTKSEWDFLEVPVNSQELKTR